MTETDGKATGWSAWYNDSKWIEETRKKSRKKSLTTRVTSKDVRFASVFRLR